jgi:hypothetical protein
MRRPFPADFKNKSNGYELLYDAQNNFPRHVENDEKPVKLNSKENKNQGYCIQLT